MSEVPLCGDLRQQDRATPGPSNLNQKSIFKTPRQFLAINAHTMAPRTTQWLQERRWNAPTKGLAWGVGGCIHNSPELCFTALLSTWVSPPLQSRVFRDQIEGPKSIARGKLTFDERVVLHRVDNENLVKKGIHNAATGVPRARESAAPLGPAQGPRHRLTLGS